MPLGSKKATFVAHAQNGEVIHALETLMGLPQSKGGGIESAAGLSIEKYKSISKLIATHGAFMADQTRMGKTILVSIF